MPEVDGCLDLAGNVLGTYVHGLFHNHELRRAILVQLAAAKGGVLPASTSVLSREEQYDRLADHVRGSLDMSLIHDLIEGAARR